MTTPPRLADLPRSRPLVGASILAADFANLGDECRAALDAGADYLHVDIMDGHFVPNLAMGPEITRSLRRALPDAVLDVHLMVQYPEQFIDPFADAGANHITVHAEVIDPARFETVADEIREAGASAGVSVKPRTRLGGLVDPLAAFDLVLVMSVEPGFAGQAFIEGTPDRLELLRRELPDRVRLQVDGGVTPETAGPSVAAGADLTIAASAIFKKPRDAWPDIVEALRGR